MKYEFTDETQVFEGVTVRRIRRLSDGLLGGWIEREANLIQEESCFVYDEAVVFGDACVTQYAQVRDHAVAGDRAVLRYAAILEGHARMYDGAMLSNASAKDYSELRGCCLVFGNALIQQHAVIKGNARVTGGTVSGHVQVRAGAVVNARVDGWMIVTETINGGDHQWTKEMMEEWEKENQETWHFVLPERTRCLL